MACSVYTPSNRTSSEMRPPVVLVHGARDNHETFDRYAVGPLLDHKLMKVFYFGSFTEGYCHKTRHLMRLLGAWHDGSYLYRDWVVSGLNVLRYQTI